MDFEMVATVVLVVILAVSLLGLQIIKKKRNSSDFYKEDLEEHEMMESRRRIENRELDAIAQVSDKSYSDELKEDEKEKEKERKKQENTDSAV